MNQRLLIFQSLVLALLTLYGSNIYAQNVSFESLTDSTEYADLLDIGDILTIEQSVIVSLDSIEGIASSSFYATTVPQCGAPTFTSGIHMYNYGTLLFDPSNLNDTINTFDFNYNYPCGEPFTLDFVGIGEVELMNSDRDVILDNNIRIQLFNGYVSCQGDFGAVKIGGRKLALDELGFYFDPQECHFSNFEVRQNPCFNFEYTVDIAFDHVGVQDSFEVYIDGLLDGSYSYDALPLELGPFDGDGVTGHQIEVRDQLDALCSAEGNFGPVLCDPDNCSISNLTITPKECINEFFYPIEIDFDYNNVNAPVFNVFSSQGRLGFFQYGTQPVTVNMPATHPDYMEYIIVSDNNNPDCADTIFFAGQECIIPPCIINTLDIHPQDCNEGQYFFSVQVKGQNTSESYDLYINDSLYQTVNYAQQPAQIGVFRSNDTLAYNFRVEDHEDIGCSIQRQIPPVNCADTMRCEIFNVQVFMSGCQQGLVDVLIDFNYFNTSDTFALTGNQRLYGFYAYSDLPIVITDLVGDGTKDFEFVISDTGSPCRNKYQLGPIQCPECTLELDELIVGECNNDLTVNVFVDLDYANLSGDFVELIGPLGSLGLFLIEDEPYNIHYPISGDQEYIRIVDPGNPVCGDSLAFEVPDCRAEECSITMPFINRFICNGDSLTIELTFTALNTSDSFTVIANNTDYGIHAYSDLPVDIGPLPGDGQTVIDMKVTDVLTQKCSRSFRFGPVQCISSTKEADRIALSIVPNPVRDRIQIVTEANIRIIRSELYSSSGRKIAQWTGPYFDTEEMMSGLYFVRVYTEKGPVTRRVAVVK